MQLRTLSIASLILLSESATAQSSGTLFLSTNTLEKSEYSYEVDQYWSELDHPERFSNSDWKYHPGDDMNWKEPSLNDGDWSMSNTNFELDRLASGSWQGIGWYRLKLIIDSSLFNRSVALVINHYGASELFMDGELINQYGQPSMNPTVERTYHPSFCKPIILTLDNKREHLLAVRYSFLSIQPLYRKYKTIMSILLPEMLVGFSIHFGETKRAVQVYGESLTNNLLVAMTTLSALLLIMAYHLLLYRHYARQRSNLYIAIFNLILGAFTLAKFLPTYARIDLGWMIVNNIALVLLGCLWLPAILFLYYSVVYGSLPKYVWLYLCWMPLYVLMHIYDFPWQVFFISMLIIFLDVCRLFVRSAKLKQPHAWIIGVGVLISQAGLTLWGLPWESLNVLPPQSTKLALLYILFLAVPLAMSIYNALTTAATSMDLENQLKEVKRLSALSLVQEQEKQEILTSQKEVLEQQVAERTAELSRSLGELKSTQSQLVQSEKMASLGELTAGIAHEIQNPLNFVNNFSDVNEELLVELKDEIKKGRLIEADAIADSVIGNEQKISLHGKRADAIVKNMLQHSRSNSGRKELVDINAMCDEYLRLAYHGMRAKDKTFNAKFETNFDGTIGKINVVPQDIGRVLLNLINNAFYAVTEKKRQLDGSYEPCVSITTRTLPGKVEIAVRDNGNGISERLREKIFQPFFTTKPAGQGTGLGLSLAYDIVKAHGGEIMVETEEGEGSEFIIQLPVQV